MSTAPEAGFERAMRRHVVIEGFPPNIVDSKRDKFEKLLRMRLLEKLPISEDTFKVTFVSDPTGHIVGAFVEFAREADAARAVEVCHMHNLTRSEHMRVYSWTQFAESEGVPETYVPPPVEMAQEAVDVSNSMMMDKEARPVFFVKSGEDCDVFVHRVEWQRSEVSVVAKPSPLKDNAVGRWTEMDRRRKQPALLGDTPMPCWSPLGTYLISLTPEGLKFWAGDAMEATCLIQRDKVQAVHITPSEQFAVVRLSQEVEIWDLIRSEHRRTLYGLDFDLNVWPPLKFSAGDVTCSVVRKKFERKRPVQRTVEVKNESGVIEHVVMSDTEDVYCQLITFFETATMRVIQGPDRVDTYSTKIDGLRSCEWSPTDPNLLVLIIDRGTGQGWEVRIVRVSISHVDTLAGRQPIVLPLQPTFSRTFTKAQRVDVLWHPHGTHVAAKVIIPAPNGSVKTEYCLFEVGQAASAAQQLRVDGTSLRFVWQPHGSYFAVAVQRPTGSVADGRCVVVYGFGGIKGSVDKLGQVATAATNLYWSSHTRRLLAVNYEAQTIDLVRVVGEQGAKVGVEAALKLEYKGISNVEWEPTGRYFAVWCRTDKNKPNQRPRWSIFDFNGKALHDSGDLSMMSHLAFRPLSRSVLTDADIATAQKSRKGLMDRWDASVEEAARETATKAVETRRKREEQFAARMRDIATYVAAHGLDEQRRALEAQAPSVRMVGKEAHRAKA